MRFNDTLPAVHTPGDSSMSSRPGSLRIWLSAARPRTLPAAVAPVLLGTALAWSHGAWVWSAALACLAFALLVQIGTNFANDYYDFIQGADTVERVGPRRAVAAGWVAPATMRRAMIAVFSLAFLVGLTLLNFGGWPLLVVGVSCIACGIAYTGGPYPLAYHGLGDLFVFVFFGLVAVAATYYVQAGRVMLDSLLLGAGVGALATNILLVNNYRDMETDTRAGKRTLVVRWGRRAARIQFGLAHAVSLLMPALVSAAGTRNGWILLVATGVLVMMAAVQMRRLRQARSAPELIALLGGTGRHVAIYALLVSVWLVAGPSGQ